MPIHLGPRLLGPSAPRWAPEAQTDLQPLIVTIIVVILYAARGLPLPLLRPTTLLQHVAGRRFLASPPLLCILPLLLFLHSQPAHRPAGRVL
jgi:hypothetical protein